MYLSGIGAACAAALAWAFVELSARHYPSRETWARLRRERGRIAVVTLRARLEELAALRALRVVLAAVVVAGVAWAAASRTLHLAWWAVASDLAPYALAAGLVARLPYCLRAIAGRMRTYEDASGEGR